MTIQMTKTHQDALRLRDAGHDLDETARITGMTVTDVWVLWRRDDEVEDAELNAICDERRHEVAIEVDINSI